MLVVFYFNSISFIFHTCKCYLCRYKYYKIFTNILTRSNKVIVLNVEEILKKQGKTKTWLCDQLDISHYNLNKALKSGKKSITYKYLERIL